MMNYSGHHEAKYEDNKYDQQDKCYKGDKCHKHEKCDKCDKCDKHEKCDKNKIKIPRKRVCNFTDDASFDVNLWMNSSDYHDECDCVLVLNCTKIIIPLPPIVPPVIPPTPPSGNCSFSC